MTFKMTDENRTITVYNLRADTHEFIGKGDALIPAHTGLPANCTTTEPPETKAGFIPVFNMEKQQWIVMEDHRGEVVFDTQTGNARFISELGAYPAGTTTIPKDSAWQKWDGSKWVSDPDAERVALVSEAETTKTSLMKQASEVISTLQDAVDFDMATDKEQTLLVAWKKYRVLLSRVNPDDAGNIIWPEVPDNVA
ncbi:tail fiber assembly protein [Escherichia coli]